MYGGAEVDRQVSVMSRSHVTENRQWSPHVDQDDCQSVAELVQEDAAPARIHIFYNQIYYTTTGPEQSPAK